MSLVSAGRLAQVIGLAATLTFGLFFAAWRTTGSKQRIGTAALVGVMTFFLTAVGGSTFRSAHLPSYRAVYVMGVSLVAALALVGVVLLSRKWWSLVPLALLAAGVTGPSRHGRSASRTCATDRRLTGSTRWSPTLRPSADRSAGRPTTSSRMPCSMANAVPAVSGQQWAGPDRAAWEILDPDDSEEQTWNRGATYINFAWGRAGFAAHDRAPVYRLHRGHPRPVRVGRGTAGAGVRRQPDASGESVPHAAARLHLRRRRALRLPSGRLRPP